ncbi:hypothetical protein, conserved [Eimeria maxima]|uniref:Uncharacterized protein n=1 Tax=Eimeria maxima TaxID=5804 RepID=U6M8S0_EIMMA|nr:hypothetical protein, conserved [Eimeria maxima]CDJ59468.1 hypothetical protein, conserved [Eimeria maxima]
MKEETTLQEEEKKEINPVDLKEIPVWLPLQRCRGLGWMHGSHWGCIGIIDSGLDAAIFSRVQLVGGEEGDSLSAAAAPVVAPAPAAAAAAEAGGRGGREAEGDAVLRVLDNVTPVEMEAAPGEAAEVDMGGAAAAGAAGGGGGAAADMFAALLLPSSPFIKKDAKIVEGDFTVLHKVKDYAAETDEIGELQVCCGEMLWHPRPPLLIACRSLWASPQRMRLSKTANNSDAAAAAVAAAAAAAGGTAPDEFLVLSDVEEGEEGKAAAAEESQQTFRAAGLPKAALHALKGTLKDREAFSRIAAETATMSVQSLRQMPATLTRLSSATAEVLYKASADWAAAGSAAIQAAATSAAKMQKTLRDLYGKSSSSNSNSSSGSNSNSSSNTNNDKDKDSHA